MTTSRTYTVTGMTCHHCVASVTEEIQKLGGVTDVDVELESGRVVVTSDEPLSNEALTAAIDEAGYELKS